MFTSGEYAVPVRHGFSTTARPTHHTTDGPLPSRERPVGLALSRSADQAAQDVLEDAVVAVVVALTGGVDAQRRVKGHDTAVTLGRRHPCLLYTSDAADERSSVDLGGRRIIKKKKWQYSRCRRFSTALVKQRTTLESQCGA